MYYQIVDENNEVFVGSRTVMNTTLSITFKDIPEENKMIELDNAAYLRFKHYYFIEDVTAINIYNNTQYLKLIPQNDNNSGLDIPSLSLMA